MGNRLDTAYARALIDLELARYRSQLWEPISEHEQLQKYAMSTQNRRLFCLLVTKCNLDNSFEYPSYVSKELGISRNTVDTMIKETHEAGWIIVERDQNQYRKIMGAKVMTDVYLAYSNAVGDYSQETDLSGLNSARKHAKLLGLYTPNHLPL